MKMPNLKRYPADKSVLSQAPAASLPPRARLFRFPNIPRLIPEWTIQIGWPDVRLFLVSFVSGFLLMAIGLKCYELSTAYTALYTLGQQKTAIEASVTKWKGIVEKYPTYRDGYFQLALLERKLGNQTSSQQYLGKVLSLDPNYLPAQKL